MPGTSSPALSGRFTPMSWLHWWKRHDDQSGGREKRFPLREAQGSEDLDEHRHVCAGLDCGSRRGPCPQSQLDYQSRRRRSVLPTETDRGVAGCTSAC